MIKAAKADREIIRKAGMTTTVLQALAVVLIIVLASIYNDISHRYSALQDGVRENAMWSVYQLDREARTVRETLGSIIAKQEYTQERMKFLALNFNILYSRMTTLEDAHFESNFRVDETVIKQIRDIKRTVYDNTSLFDDIDAGEDISPASLANLNYELGVMVRNTGDLLVHTNNTLSSDRADARTEVLYLEKKSLFLIGLLVVCVAMLVFMLRRQLKSVRAAGLSLEKMAERVNGAYHAAEAGNQAKSQFMATMGHEIRTPLNAILGMVEILQLSALPPDVSSGVQTIQRSGEALLDIINEILDFSKIEHGHIELERRFVDVRVLAESVIDIMRGRAAEGRNEIRLDLPETFIVPAIMSDPTRIRQIILNLVSNGLKFTSKGIVTLQIREIGAAPTNRLRVEVTDTGIGIDERGLEKLFQPFSQVDASINRKYGGTGLGLTICKKIVERLDGEIGVVSTPGKGSTFWFEIPVEIATESPKAAFAAPSSELPKLRILLVEDNIVNQQVASKLLMHLGQDVTIAGDGAEAVDITSKKRFDLVLMDMQMPVMDGIEATAKIRARNDASSLTPIVAMTANASEDDRKRCVDSGMTGFRSKPISIASLRSLLSEFAMRDDVSPTSVTEPLKLQRREPVFHEDAFTTRKAEIVAALGEATFQELLAAFFDDAASLVADLHKALALEDHGSIDRLLHTLKGSAANVGVSFVAMTSQHLRSSTPSAQDIDELASAIRESRTILAA